MTDLAILYEHPTWFEPLFSTLDACGLRYEKVQLSGYHFDPAATAPLAPVVLNRVAMSNVVREHEHAIFHAQALLAHSEDRGGRVLNGSAVMALDASKARQLSLLTRLGLAVPRTRVLHRVRDLSAAAIELTFPLLVKANVGGAGAGIQKFESAAELAEAAERGAVPRSVDGVLLLQEYIPARDGAIIRMETLGGRFLYALKIENGDDSFDVCPADACLAQPGRASVAMKQFDPPREIIQASERIVRAAGIDVGGVELLFDDRNGRSLFYDINALSNFVARPLDVLGWDPHERLVDYLEAIINQKA